MTKTSPTLTTPLRERLEKLAAFQPQHLPVLSLYLNLQPDQQGRENYDTFVRKVFAERRKGFGKDTPKQASFERDIARIQAYLDNDVNRAANGVAIFACAGVDDFFDAVQLEAPVAEHWLFVSSVPHLYPLARLVDQYPRYAAVVLDTNKARIFVFSLGALEKQQEVRSDKVRRTSVGGWSQARYQRHADNWHLLHVKDVVETLDRIVRAENIPHVIVAGDEVVWPILKEQLPRHLQDKLVDVLRLETHAGEKEILQATLDALRAKDAESDAEIIDELVNAWQSGGLGVVGPEATLKALTLGQVDHLIIAGSETTLKPVQATPMDVAPEELTAETSHPSGVSDVALLKLAGQLVRLAEQTGARIRFIENADLMTDLGGVGALLRFRI